MCSNHSPTSSTLVNEIEHEQDYMEYISDEKDKETSAYQSVNSHSNQDSKDRISQHHSQRPLGLIDLWGNLRKDLSEMENKGVFENDCILYNMVEDIASVEHTMNNNAKVSRNEGSKISTNVSRVKSGCKLFVETDDQDERQRYDEFQNLEEDMVDGDKRNCFLSSLQSSKSPKNSTDESEIGEEKDPRKSYKSRKKDLSNDEIKRKNTSFLKSQGRRISMTRREKREDSEKLSNFSKSGTHNKFAGKFDRGSGDLQYGLQKVLEMPKVFPGECCIQDTEVPDTEATQGKTEMQNSANELECIEDCKTYRKDNFNKSVEHKDTNVDEGQFSTRNKFSLQTKHSKEQHRAKNFPEDANIIRYFEDYLWKNYEMAVDGQKNVQELEKWCYDEIINAEKSDAKNEALLHQMDAKNFEYPLTRQMMKERDYEIRKKEAWKKWLLQKDENRLRKALLDIQQVMLSQRNKGRILHPRLKRDKKDEKFKISNLSLRKKEIARKIAIEEQNWKKKMKEWKKIQQEKESSNTRRRKIFRASFSPKFDMYHFDKNVRADIELQETEEDNMQKKKTLPRIELSNSVIVNTPSPKKNLHPEISNEETAISPVEEELVKGNDTAQAVEGREVIKMHFPKYRDKIKLFDFLDSSKSIPKNESICIWKESKRDQWIEKIEMGHFQIRPKKIVFKDFVPGMSYHSKVVVQNLDMKTRQLYVIGLWYVDESLNNQGILELDGIGNLPKIFHIKPGLKCDIWINFKPRSIADSTAVSAQLVFMTAQRPLLATVDEWAKLNRSSIPDKVKDAGYIFISIQCRNARPEPKVTSSVVIFNYHRNKNEEELVKKIDIVNKGALDCYYRIEKNSDDLEECSSNIKGKYEETGVLYDMHARKSNTENQLKRPSKLKVLVASTKESSGEIKSKEANIKTLTETTSSESKSVVEALLKYMTDMATSIFDCNPTFGVLKAHSSIQVTIKLQKERISIKDNFREFYYLQFDNNSKTQEIPLWISCHSHREVEKLTVNKKYIDFGICVAGGVYQDCLEVYNGYECARGVVLIIEKFAKPQMKHIKNLISPHAVEVIPKGVTFVQPHSFYPFLVRLFVRKSEESLNTDSGQGNISNENLIFDVKLYSSISRTNTHGATESLTKHLICRIPAFASLSDVTANLKCHPLILDPPILNLGSCLTTETIKANFKIISNSRITLTYGFLNLPKYITIQPGYGFGQILPKETLQLDLFFSPLKEHGCASPGKKFTFQIKCYNVLNMANPDFTIYAAMDVEVTVIHIPDVQLSCSLVCFPVTTCGSCSMASFLLSSIKDLTPKVKAGVQEKLQSQNAESDDNAEYCYEFLSQTDEILVYPQQGCLKLGQTIKIHLLFTPKLKNNEIIDKARAICEKAKKIVAEKGRGNTDHTEESYEQEKRKKKKRNTPAIKSKTLGHNETETKGIRSPAPSIKYENFLNEIKHFIKPAEIILLKEFKSHVIQSKIACLLGKNHKEEESRSRKSAEMIFIDVACPVISPGFLILECEEFNLLNQNTVQGFKEEGTSTHSKIFNTHLVHFGPVAINGGKRTLTISLQNISASSPMYIIPATLNPKGPFSSPCLLMMQFKSLLETKEALPSENSHRIKKYTAVWKNNKVYEITQDGILRIPVTFAPTAAGIMREYLDIRGTSNDGFITQKTIELYGLGEIPQFNFQPNPPVVILKQNQSKIPKTSVIKIQNLCRANLEFRIGKINVSVQESIYKIKRESLNTVDMMNEREQNEEIYSTLSDYKTTKWTKYEGKAEEMNAEYKTENIHAAEQKIDKAEKNTQETQKCIYIDPPECLVVQGHSTGSVTIHCLPCISTQRKIITFPLTLFNKRVADVEVLIQ